MRTVEVVLGGQTYTVPELPVRKNAAWRKQLQEHFGALVTALRAAPSRELGTLHDVADILGEFSALLIGSVDVVTELLLAYSDDLWRAREAIEANAYESEIMEAFAKVLPLAFPFGVWGERAQGLIQQMSSLSANNTK